MIIDGHRHLAGHKKIQQPDPEGHGVPHLCAGAKSLRRRNSLAICGFKFGATGEQAVVLLYTANYYVFMRSASDRQFLHDQTSDGGMFSTAWPALQKSANFEAASAASLLCLSLGPSSVSFVWPRLRN